jgi:hypothetical protein
MLHAYTTRTARLFLSEREQNARRGSRTALVAGVAFLLLVLVGLQRSGLQNATFTTGYALLAGIVTLISLHWRKLTPSLPLGRVSAWLQVHVYVGYLTIVVFALHVRLRWPSGPMETLLYGLFVIVAAGGVGALVLSRSTARRLCRLADEVRYELIPDERRKRFAEANALIAGSPDVAATLVTLYRNRLATYFGRPRHWTYYLHPTSTLRRQLLAALEELPRYLSTSQRELCQRMVALVKRKDDLDYQHALQWRLRTWVLAHTGLSYSLLILSLLHALVAHAFAGASQ